MSPPHVVVASTNCRILMSPPPVEVASHLLWLVYMGCCVHAPEGPHSVHGLSWPRARKVPSCTWAVVSTRLEGSLVYMGSRGYAPKMIRAIFWRASPFPPHHGQAPFDSRRMRLAPWHLQISEQNRQWFCQIFLSRCVRLRNWPIMASDRRVVG